MRSSEFDVSINAVKYRLAEDAEGDSYVRLRQSMRPPNSQIVQGQSGVFNPRPDLLLWSWTDWSEGEGQLVWSAEGAKRSRVLSGVNPFSRPGMLEMGYGADLMKNSSATTETTHMGFAVVGQTLYGVGIGAGNDDYYAFDTVNDDRWLAGTSMALTDGARHPASVCADDTAIWFVLHNTGDVYKVVPGGAVTKWNDQAGTGGCQLIESGDYLYKFNNDGTVYELSKATANLTTAETAILDFSDSGGHEYAYARTMVAGDNRIYLMANRGFTSYLYEIVPTSASTTGFGSLVSTIAGLVTETLWWHGGFLWWTGIDMEPQSTDGYNRSIYYYQPGAAWGTVGSVRGPEDETLDGVAAGQAVRLHAGGFAVPGTYEGRSASSAAISLFEIDALSGGIAEVGRKAAAESGLQNCSGMVYWNGKYIVQHYDDTLTYHQTIWKTYTYGTSGVAHSSSIQFGISGEKVLHSIELVTEPLPANTSVTVGYSLDGGSWTDLTAYDTDGGTGTKWTVSTNAATKSFRNLSLRLTLVGTSTATPTIRSVDVRASIDETTNVWQLALDCTDESSPRGFDGATLIDNITALADSTVVAFIDGYEQRTFSDDTTYDVVVDSMQVVLDRPGEGVIYVTLREVF